MGRTEAGRGLPTVDRALDLLAVFVVATSLVGLITTLAGWFHAPQVLLLSLLLTGVYAFKTSTARSLLGNTRPRLSHVLLLIIVALLFRVPAYNYVLGGQDEGLYTNIGQYIERTGGIRVTDGVASKLSGTPYLEHYLKENRFSKVWGDPYVLGVYSTRNDPTKLQFQFYHTFPAWIATFAGVFGQKYGVYALTFLALVSILFFYRLALVLTDSYSAALFAGLFLALSPLHAFFSKFPVAEVPALAFTTIAFTYAAAYWVQRDRGAARRSWLVLSVLAFLCMFTTRMSGFTWMPFFVAVAVAAAACDSDMARRRAIQLWAAGVVVVFLVSAAYGFRWAHQTVVYNYGAWFGPLLGKHWLRAVTGLIVVGLGAWGAVTWYAAHSQSRQVSVRRLIVQPVRAAIGPLMWVIFCAGGYLVYRLAWTSRFAGTGLDSTYHLADTGWGGAVATLLPQLAIFLGPLLVIIFLVAMSRRWSVPYIEALRFFLLMFFAYGMLLRWVLPYNPYYARFLLEGLAPYLILFVVCVWTTLEKGSGLRTLLTTCFVLTLAYTGVLSAAQIGKQEESGVYAKLARLVEPVRSDDLIMLDVHDYGVLKTPLVYTFGRHVVTVNRRDLANAGYVATLASRYRTTWLVTSDAMRPGAFTYVDEINYRVPSYSHTHFAPMKLTVGSSYPLFLYRLTAPRVPMNVGESLGLSSPWRSWLEQGWSHPESWGVWSAANTATLQIDPHELPPASSGLLLRLDARTFVVPQHACQDVRVSINGEEVGNYRPCYPNSEFTVAVKIPQSLLRNKSPIAIKFTLPDAKSPESLGLSTDGRDLGVALTGFKVTRMN